MDRMESVMATAADRKRWDKLHADYAAAKEKASDYRMELGRTYGHNFQSTWLKPAQRDKLDRLETRAGKMGDKIVDLIVQISPRGDRWLSGVPSWWIRDKLTWEDAIRPANEPLSVVVPGAYGYPDGYVKETRRMSMPRAQETVEEFKEFLEKAVILVTGESSSYIDPHAEEVHVAIVVNVTGYGPHVGAIYVDQNRFHASADTALEGAHELLEEWERDHYPDAEENTETFEGRTWTLPALKFTEAIYGTKAEEFIDVDEEEDVGDEEDLDEEEYE